MKMPPAELTFGPFSFDRESAVLFESGSPVALGRRSACLLATLLEQRGKVITKADLLDAAWPKTAVEESNLSVQIAQLRRRLGRSASGADWIVTVSGIGYRFIPEELPASSGSAPMGMPSLAILPFEDLDLDGERASPVDGFVEDLTTALARFKSVSVIARRSSFQFGRPAMDARQVARNLGARYLVEGSTRHFAGNLRTTAQLIDGVTGAHLWAQHIDVPIMSEPAATSSMTECLAATVEAQIHAAEIRRARLSGDDSAQAYDYYLRGRHRLQSSRPEDNAAGYGFYLKALELEPSNVEFLAAATEVLQHRLAVGWESLTGDDRGLVLRRIDQGTDMIGLDAASLALFGIAMMNTGDEDLGLQTARRAVEINGNSSMALVVSGLANTWAGDLDEGLACYQRSLHLNPTDPIQRFALDGLAKVNCVRENFEESLMWAKRAFAFNQGLSGTYWHLIASSAHLGQMAEATRYLARYRAVSPGVTISSIEAGQPYGNRDRIRPMVQGLRLAGLPEN
ncbi:TolB-like protein/DNA-binding winged helix-turn-helix (wHTH) protein [Devosia sp. UYZn731]|uniref:winged helix-turn-helix domain-containing protein n=1 Tax=Devosia sp. UYZn731 TaxID=3156345 RepID=UPI0033925689